MATGPQSKEAVQRFATLEDELQNALDSATKRKKSYVGLGPGVRLVLGVSL